MCSSEVIGTFVENNLSGVGCWDGKQPAHKDLEYEFKVETAIRNM